jgi:hypothetical protein
MSLKQNVIKEFERAFPVRSVLSCDDGVMIITSYKFKQFLPLLLSLIEQEVMKCVPEMKPTQKKDGIYDILLIEEVATAYKNPTISTDLSH